MHRLSFSLKPAAQLDTDRPRVTPTSHRRNRLSDIILEAFRLALSRGDLGTAEDLLAVLTAMDERYRMRSPGERRQGNAMLEQARLDLEARKAARYRRF